MNNSSSTVPHFTAGDWLCYSLTTINYKQINGAVFTAPFIVGVIYNEKNSLAELCEFSFNA